MRLVISIGVYHVAKTDAPSMVVIAYRGRLVDGAVFSAGAEMLEVAVFQPDSLPPLAFPSHRAVLAEYLKPRAESEGELATRIASAQAPSETRPSPGRAAMRLPRKR